jgi:deoxyguanosine kinase
MDRRWSGLRLESQKNKQEVMPASRFIVIEGPIGVGKTSLARRLSESLESELLLEQAEANPFLERFYRNPRSAALPTQLFFLFQRIRQVEDLRQADIFSDVRVADFLIEKDRLFAQINLDRHELELYDRVYDSVAVDPPVPDLVVYLQAPVDTWLFRIERRGIDYEQRIERHYLERLNEAYARFFHDYDAAPLLIVNAATIDPINNEQHYGVLLDEIRRVHSGRHFFNPVVSVTA